MFSCLSTRALVVHGADGLDEITTRGPTDAVLLAEGAVSPISINPASLGFPPPIQGALRGGTADESAEIVNSLLEGETGTGKE